MSNNTPLSEQLRNAIPALSEFYDAATNDAPPSSVGFSDEGTRIIHCGIEVIRYGVYWREINRPGHVGEHERAVKLANKAVERIGKALHFPVQVGPF